MGKRVLPPEGLRTRLWIGKSDQQLSLHDCDGAGHRKHTGRTSGTRRHNQAGTKIPPRDEHVHLCQFGQVARVGEGALV